MEVHEEDIPKTSLFLFKCVEDGSRGESIIRLRLFRKTKTVMRKEKTTNEMLQTENRTKQKKK